MASKTTYYFIGIGGIGMSALARYYNSMGHKVAGYDKTQTPLCIELEKEGIAIHYQDSVSSIPKEFKTNESTSVIYTPAIPAEHTELNYFRDQEFRLLKRAEALGEISKNHTCLAIAGTHGKTTTSALLAHLFVSADRKITAFLGGISANYQTNFLAGNDSELMIVEADEFDRSFLKLKPEGAAITSIDADHLDIYGESDEVVNSFNDFRNLVSEHIIVHEATGLQGSTYSIEGTSDYSARNVRIENHQYLFDLMMPNGELIENITSGLPGRHNVENAVAAAALASNYGLNYNQIADGIASFKGVKRRFDYHIKSDDLVFIDDYAHHPAEINALLNSVKELYPGKRITGVFQPHLYTRTRDFADEFAESLSALDELLLMDIFPAREKPIPGINANMLLSKIKLDSKQHLSSQEILTHLEQNRPEVILTIGAGDIANLVGPLKMKLLQ